ncbi:hypothetical protein RM844_24965 [Streptomyces sp. DSM 44915]|uniref:Uncharacterized protein n=1 Tax=Streptomyces chisholmiae TaxID=3075540 RepID=A0ABU2JX10_9ACTN|nr:hypothetical protein [Streptomyces sp. DSM 44915]MDT0269538.1 hypothetical protein [Streptomyces sp. DSM 44915]
MSTISPVVFPAQRPLVRWGVLRRARITVEGGRLTVRRRTRTHRWPVGPEGVASAVYLRGRLCPSAARTGWGTMGLGQINDAGGCLHLCDGAGRALACLALSDWVPAGGAPVPLSTPDQVPAPRLSVVRDGDYLTLSGLADFLRHHGVAVTEHAEGGAPEPPRAPGFRGTLRPGARDAVPTLLTLLAVVQIPLSLLAAFFFGGLADTDHLRWTLYSAPFLVFALCGVGAALLLGIAGLRAGRTVASAELRPRPGVPTTRAFQRHTVLRFTESAIELRTAQRRMRLISPPADPVTGVREAVVFDDEGRPWGVALADERGAVHAFLHWDTWFAGDPELTGLDDFCRHAGLAQRRHRLPAFPGRQPEDQSARVWRRRDYGHRDQYALHALLPWVSLGGLVPLFYGATLWEVDWPPFFAMLGAALAVGVVPYVVRGAYRKWSLNQLVQPVVAGAGSLLDKRTGAAS